MKDNKITEGKGFIVLPNETAEALPDLPRLDKSKKEQHAMVTVFHQLHCLVCVPSPFPFPFPIPIPLFTHLPAEQIQIPSSPVTISATIHLPLPPSQLLTASTYEHWKQTLKVQST